MSAHDRTSTTHLKHVANFGILNQSDTSDKATAELSAVVDELLNQLSVKFSTVSEELLTKSMFSLLHCILYIHSY
jgi:hypothetical protein